MVEIPVRAGQPFRLATRWSTGSSYHGHRIRQLDLTGQLEFLDLPPGARVTSCHGFGGGPVSGALAHTRAEAFHDQVALAWAGADPGAEFRIERAVGDASWQPLRVLVADGEGRLAYLDADILPDQRLRYRLTDAAGRSFATVEVVVPGVPRFALRVVGDAARRGEAVFAVSLSPGRNARLELFDVAGRRVAAQPVAADPSGSRVVSLAGTRLQPGLYLARLSSGADLVEARVVLTR